jgi:hypothetical protein
MLPSAPLLDDDEPELEAPATAPAPIARAPGAAAALDQFSRASPAGGDNPHPVAATDDAREEGEERDHDQSAAATATDDPAPADDYEHFQRIQAYEAGKRAKAAGHARKALPPEFREPAATRQALAWTAGFDGQSLPEFNES